MAEAIGFYMQMRIVLQQELRLKGRVEEELVVLGFDLNVSTGGPIQE